ATMGELFRNKIQNLRSKHISLVRGKGLLNAIVTNHVNPDAAMELCLQLKDNGLLAKPTHGDKIRFAPPLIITKEQILECVDIISNSLSCLD
ncbi:MAG: aminotransferase class III-fold pyridoxal phosphate-dependent enzyme, partial [Bacteroidia bacterium]|nr:aminotransferase class III-fold pyridoxal phosphate-dependent enzyme [Bacteroidia bacterium]